MMNLKKKFNEKKKIELLEGESKKKSIKLKKKDKKLPELTWVNLPIPWSESWDRDNKANRKKTMNPNLIKDSIKREQKK